MGTVLATVRQVAAGTRSPIVVMSYLSSVRAYGPQRLADALAEAGAAGCMVPDLPAGHAAHDHLTAADGLGRLAQAAFRLYRLSWAFHLTMRASGPYNESGWVLERLVRHRQIARDWEGAAAIIPRAADAGDVYALLTLASRYEEDGDRAEAFILRAVRTGDDHALLALARLWGDQRAAEAWAQETGTDAATTLARLPRMRWELDPLNGPDSFKPRTPPEGSALIAAAVRRLRDGDPGAAKGLARQAADAGAVSIYDFLSDHDVDFTARLKAWWPYGLDPDGTPSEPW